ncbi:MAG: hypothetical protein JO260_06585, partial [Acidobacteria bacterium]|nr:hypothetical protein [Acidobacteriota bacterium]
MAGRRELLVAGSARFRIGGMIRIAVFAFSVFASLPSSSLSCAQQSSSASEIQKQDFHVKSPLPGSDAARLVEAQTALDQGRYDEAVRLSRGPTDQSGDFDFVAGLALAKLQRWQEARAALLRGQRKETRQARFLVELAGIDYKLKDARAAKRKLRAAQRLDPKDEYTLEFLGTLYFLDGNVEAALKYWN